MQRNTPTPEEIKSSLTALSIAQGFTRALAMEYGYLFDDAELPLSSHICKSVIAGGVPEQFRTLLSSPYAEQRLFCNKNYIPAYDQTTMLRKLMIKNKIDQLTQNGTQQIVFLGGGYDMRPFMTAKTREVKVYELDRGPTRAKKLAAIQSIPESFRFGDVMGKAHEDGTVIIDDKLFLVECDFIKDNLDQKLKTHGFKKDLKTLIIAEGLTAYLSFEENKKLLSILRSLMKASDELLIGYIDKGEKTAELIKTLKEAKEEHKLALEPENIVAFADESGFATMQQFFPTKALAKIGDQTDADLYNHKRNLIREYYIFLQVGKSPYQHFHEVPHYEFAIQPKENLVARAASA